MEGLLFDVGAKRLRVRSDDVDHLLSRLRRSRKRHSVTLRAKIDKARRRPREPDVIVVDERDAAVLAHVLDRPPRLRGDLLMLRNEIELRFHRGGRT
jgi:hypothetical protein